MSYYDAVADLATRQALIQLEILVRRFAVASDVQYLTVTFPSTANQDQIVQHHLVPPASEAVFYEVVKADRACRVYNDQSSTRKAWAATYIVLRCDTASAVVTLRLFAKSS